LQENQISTPKPHLSPQTDVICDTSIFTRLSKQAQNSSRYSFNQSEESSNFDLIIRNLQLSDEILNSLCLFTIFDQISLKEIGKIDVPFKNLLNTKGEIKAHTLFFDLGSLFMPGFKAILHLKTLKKSSENIEYSNYDGFLRFFSEKNHTFLEPIYGYSVRLDFEEKHHLKLLYELYKQNNTDCVLPLIEDFSQNFSLIKYHYFSYILDKTSESIARSNRNLARWTYFLDELASFQADLRSDIEEKQDISQSQSPIEQIEENLLIIDSFIEKEIKNTEEKKVIIMNKFSIFSSIFCRIDEWEKTYRGKWFYHNVQTLCKEGIPFVLRETFWLEFGRLKNIILETETVLGLLNQTNEEGDRRKFLYDRLFMESKNCQSVNMKEFFEDLDFYVNNDFYKVSIHEISILKKIFQTMIYWKSLFITKKILYSKELISLAIKIIRFYKVGNNSIYEENVFWLFLTVLNNGLQNYFCLNQENSESFLMLIPNGIKADLLVLEILIQEHLPDVYKRISQFALPVMHYFAKHMLSLFADILNEEMCFRLWDVLFFEAGAGGQVFH